MNAKSLPAQGLALFSRFNRRGKIAHATMSVALALALLSTTSATAAPEEPNVEAPEAEVTAQAETFADSDNGDAAGSDSVDELALPEQFEDTQELAAEVPEDSGLANLLAQAPEAASPSHLIHPYSSGTVCEPGVIYSVGANGQIYSNNLAAGTRSTVGNAAGNANGNYSHNGIAVSADGPIFTFQRQNYPSTNRPTGTHRFRVNSTNPVTGNRQEVANWYSTTGLHPVNNSGGYHFDMIAGAVNPATGDYYLGGYATVYQYSPHREVKHLHLWKYSNGSISSVGSFEIASTRSTTMTNANGDFAFNKEGDLLVLYSAGNQATILTVGSADLESANGGTLPYSQTRTLTLASGAWEANGIAFDADGGIYLGTITDVYKYSPSNWRLLASYPNVLRSTSTDLASCHSPTTLEIKKNVVDRGHPSDQFQLAVADGGQTFADAVTTGTQNGVQAEKIGPVAIQVGHPYRVSETMASGSASSLSDYDSSYVCTVSGETAPIASGSATEFQLSVAEQHSGSAVSCVFTNTPQQETTLTLIKQFDTSYGAPEAVEDWNLTATPADSSNVIDFDSGQTQEVVPGDYTVSETFGPEALAPEDAGYELASITCTTGEDEYELTDGQLNVPAGMDTECVLLNQDLPGSVAWLKTDTQGEALEGSVWELQSPDGTVITTVTDNGENDTDPRHGYVAVDELSWGEYQLVEVTAPEGYYLLQEPVDFVITGTERDYEFAQALENIAIPTLTLIKEFDINYGAPAEVDQWNLKATGLDGTHEFDSGDTHEVSAGDYSIWETFGPDNMSVESAGYTLQNVVCVVDDGDPVELERGSAGFEPITVVDDTATTCVLTNADRPGDVQWNKINPDGIALGDSEWELAGPDGFGTITIVDNDGQWDHADETGTLRVEELHWGDYTLTETRAPAGFELDAEPRQFTISGTQLSYLFDEDFVNNPLTPGTLPLTGVFSDRWPLLAGGLGLAVLALFSWSILRSREQAHS